MVVSFVIARQSVVFGLPWQSFKMIVTHHSKIATSPKNSSGTNFVAAGDPKGKTHGCVLQTPWAPRNDT
jgi:hypothetical protein